MPFCLGGFQLQKLRLQCTQVALTPIINGLFKSVHTLDLWLEDKVDVGVVRLLASAFDNLPNLASLTLRLSINAQSALQEVTWTFPVLQSLKLGYEIFCLPTITCSSLTALDVQARPEAVPSILPLCLSNPNLQSLVVDEPKAYRSEDAIVDTKAIAQFASSLAAGCWPHVSKLRVFPDYDVAGSVIDSVTLAYGDWKS